MKHCFIRFYLHMDKTEKIQLYTHTAGYFISFFEIG